METPQDTKRGIWWTIAACDGGVHFLQLLWQSFTLCALCIVCQGVAVLSTIPVAHSSLLPELSDSAEPAYHCCRYSSIQYTPVQCGSVLSHSASLLSPPYLFIDPLLFIFMLNGTFVSIWQMLYCFKTLCQQISDRGLACTQLGTMNHPWHAHTQTNPT